jgi:peptidoglycan hydrolase-like protein with peptidoglycan-binding domain
LIIDGIFGLKTQKSIVFFQQANKLIPDGIVGPKTRAKLQ